MPKIKPINLVKFSVTLLVISLLIILFTLLETFELNKNTQDQIVLAQNLERCELTAGLMAKSTDYLSEQALYFVVTHDMTYFNNYWNESNHTQRRERAFQEFKDLDLTDDELVLIEKASDASMKLSSSEKHATALIVSGLHVDEAKLPTELYNFRLTEEELQLSTMEKFTAAYNSIFDDSYHKLSDEMNNSLNLFTESLRNRYRTSLNDAVKDTTSTLRTQRIFILILIGIMVLLFNASIGFVVVPISKYIGELDHKKYLTPTGSKELRRLAEALNNQYNQVRLNEERFRIAASRISQLILEYDVDENSVHFLTQKHIDNETFKNLNNTGLEKWMELVHPDDKMQVDEVVAHLKSGSYEDKIDLRLKNLRKGFTGYRWYHIITSEILRENTGTKRLIVSLEDIDKQYQENVGLRYKAEHDLLTGLLNRTTFENEIEYQLQESDSVPSDALLLLDIDDFKVINDTEGHDIGDVTLKKLALALSSCFRDTDIIGRLGGDEFVIWMKGVAYKNRLIEFKIEELNRILAEADSPDDNQKPMSISTSIGISFLKEGDTFTDVYRRADEALYHAKRSGKNQCSFYEERTTEEE